MKKLDLDIMQTRARDWSMKQMQKFYGEGEELKPSLINTGATDGKDLLNPASGVRGTEVTATQPRPSDAEDVPL